MTQPKVMKMSVESIPGKDLTAVVDVRPNTVTRGVLFKWQNMYIMTVLDSNVDYMAPDWELTAGLGFPPDISPVACVQSFFGWATMCIFDPDEAKRQLDALIPDEVAEPTPTLN